MTSEIRRYHKYAFLVTYISTVLVPIKGLFIECKEAIGRESSPFPQQKFTEALGKTQIRKVKLLRLTLLIVTSIIIGKFRPLSRQKEGGVQGFSLSSFSNHPQLFDSQEV